MFDISCEKVVKKHIILPTDRPDMKKGVLSFVDFPTTLSFTTGVKVKVSFTNHHYSDLTSVSRRDTIQILRSDPWDAAFVSLKSPS